MIERLQHCDDAPGASKGRPLDKKNYYFQAFRTVWTSCILWRKGQKIVFFHGIRLLLFLQCLNVNVLFYKGGFF